MPTTRSRAVLWCRVRIAGMFTVCEHREYVGELTSGETYNVRQKANQCPLDLGLIIPTSLATYLCFYITFIYEFPMHVSYLIPILNLSRDLNDFRPSVPFRVT